MKITSVPNHQPVNMFVKFSWTSLSAPKITFAHGHVSEHLKIREHQSVNLDYPKLVASTIMWKLETLRPAPWLHMWVLGVSRFV